MQVGLDLLNHIIILLMYTGLPLTLELTHLRENLKPFVPSVLASVQLAYHPTPLF